MTQKSLTFDECKQLSSRIIAKYGHYGTPGVAA